MTTFDVVYDSDVQQLAAAWVHKNIGRWRRSKRPVTQSEVECAFLAGYLAGIDHARDQMRKAIEKRVPNADLPDAPATTKGSPQ